MNHGADSQRRHRCWVPQLHGGLSSRELEELAEARVKKEKEEKEKAAAEAKESGEQNTEAGGGTTTQGADQSRTKPGLLPKLCGCWKRNSPNSAPPPAASSDSAEPSGPYVLVTLHASAFEDKDHTGGPSFTVRLPVATLASATVRDLKLAVERGDPMKAPPAAQQLSIFMPRSDDSSSDGDLGDGDGEHKGGGTWVTMDDDDTALAAYGIDAGPKADDTAREDDGAGVNATQPSGANTEAQHRVDVWLSRDPAAMPPDSGGAGDGVGGGGVVADQASDDGAGVGDDSASNSDSGDSS